MFVISARKKNERYSRIVEICSSLDKAQKNCAEIFEECETSIQCFPMEGTLHQENFKFVVHVVAMADTDNMQFPSVITVQCNSEIARIEASKIATRLYGVDELIRPRAIDKKMSYIFSPTFNNVVLVMTYPLDHFISDSEFYVPYAKLENVYKSVKREKKIKN